MNWIELEETDSTSLEVERHLDKGEDLAIFSHVQNAGRGQRGKEWKSLSGNLHLSLGLFRKLTYPAISLVPLQISVIICEILKEEFNISPTIKWPNDLLFSGAKIGGILCESKHIGDDTVLIIGIGFNCQTLPDGVGYKVNCLSHVVGKDIDSLDLGKKIAERVLSFSFCNSYSEFKSRYETFAIKPGHIFYTNGEKQLLHGYSEQGTLILVANGKESEEHSAGSERLWSLQMLQEDSVFLADIGNSNIKLTKHLGDGKFAPTLTIPTTSEVNDEHQKSLHNFFQNEDLTPMFFASVKPSFDSTLFSIVPKLMHLQPLRKRFVRLRSSYKLAELGLDRLLAMEGALSQENLRQKSLLVVSMGTAITLDAIDQNGNHLGGQIIPGIFLQAQSLHQYTELLPLVESPMVFDDPYGFYTEGAISSGIRDLIIGYIHLHLTQIAKLTGEVPQLVLTGGDAAKISPSFSALEDPTLIFKGMLTLVRSGA